MFHISLAIRNLNRTIMLAEIVIKKFKLNAKYKRPVQLICHSVFFLSSIAFSKHHPPLYSIRKQFQAFCCLQALIHSLIEWNSCKWMRALTGLPSRSHRAEWKGYAGHGKGLDYVQDHVEGSTQNAKLFCIDSCYTALHDCFGWLLNANYYTRHLNHIHIDSGYLRWTGCRDFKLLNILTLCYLPTLKNH